MPITSLLAEPWTLPLIAPFRVAQRSATTANNVKIEITADGILGVGACAPVSYVTGETVDSVLESYANGASAFNNYDATDLHGMLHLAKSLCANQPAALAGLELAVYDLWAKTTSTDLRTWFGGPETSVVTDMTIPIVDAHEAGVAAAELFRQGFYTLKIKVGDPSGINADFDRIAAVRKFAPDVRLRIDANQGYTPDQAIRFLEWIRSEGIDLEFIEQPVKKDDHNGLKLVRENSPYPVFADESVCSFEDARQLISLNAVDGIVVKLMKSGLSGAAQILKLCRDFGIKTMMGCMLETGIGISAAMAIGIGYGVDYYDLDSHRLLAPIPNLTVPFECQGNLLVWRDGVYGWGNDGQIK
jgi:L-alanine-DL-glutamate epimerase-like enolase superfamily enzyme